MRSWAVSHWQEMRSLEIRSQIDPEITSTRRFAISIQYCGHRIVHDDIYFDDLAQQTERIQSLASSRTGEVVLDGGMRIGLTLSAKSLGGVAIEFRAEQFEPEFPGECLLKGSFDIDGDKVDVALASLVETLSSDAVFRIDRTASSGPL